MHTESSTNYTFTYCTWRIYWHDRKRKENQLKNHLFVIFYCLLELKHQHRMKILHFSKKSNLCHFGLCFDGILKSCSMWIFFRSNILYMQFWVRGREKTTLEPLSLSWCTLSLSCMIFWNSVQIETVQTSYIFVRFSTHPSSTSNRINNTEAYTKKKIF